MILRRVLTKLMWFPISYARSLLQYKAKRTYLVFSHFPIPTNDTIPCLPPHHTTPSLFQSRGVAPMRGRRRRRRGRKEPPTIQRRKRG